MCSPIFTIWSILVYLAHAFACEMVVNGAWGASFFLQKSAYSHIA